VTCYTENWLHIIPKVQSKNEQHRETGNTRHQRQRKTSQKYNTICFRQHYTQTITNNVYKIWTVDCVLVPAFSTPHTILECTITHICYIRRRQILEIKREIYTLKACVSKYNNYIVCSFQLEGACHCSKSWHVTSTLKLHQSSVNEAPTIQPHPLLGTIFERYVKKIHCDYT
jgi:hypothetical protein